MYKYYSEKLGNITMYNADCMDVMKTFMDNQFDLSIVDPPYGLNINMNMGRKKGDKNKYCPKKWDKQIPENSYFDELMRVSKNQIIFGGNYFPLRATRSWIFWEKDIPEGVSYSDGELAWTSFNVKLRKVKIPYSGFIGKDKFRIHPTQKPISLYKWILLNYAKSGQSILDTHLGSGSIAIACHDYGYSLTGIDIDGDYYCAAKKRILNHQQQTSMDIFKTDVNIEQKKLFQ